MMNHQLLSPHSSSSTTSAHPITPEEPKNILETATRINSCQGLSTTSPISPHKCGNNKIRAK